MPNLVDLQQKRGQLITEARAMVDRAEEEKRSLTEEENVRYGKLWAEQETIQTSIKREQELVAAEKEMATRAAESKKEDRAKGNSQEQEDRSGIASDEYRSSFLKYVRRGSGALNEGEFRALSAGTDTEGGFLVPKEMSGQLIKALDNEVVIRGLATQFNAFDELGFPELTADPDDADWTVELAIGNEDSAMAFGEREFKVNPIGKLLKASNKILRNPNFNMEAFLLARLAYKMGVAQEKAFMTGTGARQPLGMFVASTNGISTARDVSTGNTTTEVTGDGLRAAKWNLKSQYQKNGKWLFHRNLMEKISKLKDGNGQYLLQPGLAQDVGDVVLSRPVLLSEYVPNTYTTAQYVGMFADFSHYYIVDSLKYRVQRLVELYAGSDQTGFIVRAELDAAPALAEAFSRIKLA
ncbi:MAG: phage major capsid protein [Candidatus Obscuribacterales bacterium]|nr:phage major capsid protein [Candidatus Obscuribacterales bacterium]